MKRVGCWLGKKRPDHSERMSGENHPNFKGGKTLVKKYCINCGIKLSKNAYYYKYKRCTSCAAKKRLKIPENNPNWRGGVSFEEYPQEFNDKLKESIRKRDNYECKNCGMTEEEHIIVWGKRLCIHHIDYDKKNIKCMII